MDEKLIRKFLSKMKCESCGREYATDNITVLGRQEDLWFFLLYCADCKRQGLVTVATSEGKMPEPLSELGEAEKGKLSTPVDVDDLLDMHIFLENFSGDFRSLFSENNE
jgi:hypothetical protein